MFGNKDFNSLKWLFELAQRAHLIFLSLLCGCPQCPEGGAVFGETLLRSAETERGISSQPEHCPGSCGGAVSVSSGGSAAGAKQVSQC